jgi:hypothetical protein
MTEPRAEGDFDDTFADDTFDDDVDLEAPENDVIEQHTDASSERRRAAAARERPLEADDADAADQDREAGLDEDEYR